MTTGSFIPLLRKRNASSTAQVPDLAQTFSKFGFIGVHLGLEFNQVRVEGVEVVGELGEVHGL